MSIRIGTAGWSIPRQLAQEFPSDGTSLSRYSARFGVAEVNSSFHRPHRESTWQRWHDSVPADFRFSVKLPKRITHEQRLVDCGPLVEDFLKQVGPLGDKLAVLLVQLPPKLGLDEAVAAAFFQMMLTLTSRKIACEPRHPSWFTPEAGALLGQLGVTRVAADPSICPAAGEPGGSRELAYWRLHGSPRMYRSSYADRIGEYAARMSSAAAEVPEVWCIFDNTASSAATADALALMRLLKSRP